MKIYFLGYEVITAMIRRRNSALDSCAQISITTFDYSKIAFLSFPALE